MHTKMCNLVIMLLDISHLNYRYKHAAQNIYELHRYLFVPGMHAEFSGHY